MSVFTKPSSPLHLLPIVPAPIPLFSAFNLAPSEAPLCSYPTSSLRPTLHSSSIPNNMVFASCLLPAPFLFPHRQARHHSSLNSNSLYSSFPVPAFHSRYYPPPSPAFSHPSYRGPEVLLGVVTLPLEAVVGRRTMRK